MIQQGHQGLLDLGPQLQNKLVVGLNRKGWGDEADVQGAAEGHEHVDRLAIVQTHDSVHAL